MLKNIHIYVVLLVAGDVSSLALSGPTAPRVVEDTL